MTKQATRLFLVLVTAAALGACGGDDGGGGDDTPDPPDANESAAVTEVSCNGATIAATVTTDGFMYEPSAVTISAGEIVQFSPTSGHDVASNDNLFSVGFAQTGCFRFDEAGTYTFRCTPHGFTGTVTVQ